MAKGQFLNSHQKGIVKRYYKNIGDLSAQKLGELISDLYLETNPAKIKQMWESAEKAMLNLGVSKTRVSKIMAEKNIQSLAKLVEELF